METRTNRRGYEEHFVTGQHLKLNNLRREAKTAGVANDYLFKKIPSHPQPEFHISHLKHDTDQPGVRGIKKSGGFIGGPMSPSLLWWSLAVGPEDLEAAERRLLAETFPERTAEQAEMQQSFLKKFATSPAFLKRSRLGSYRFTFPVEELLEAYREQFCSGAQPMMRVFETVLYKQEVMYAVLIHSPENEEMFSQYPLLPDDPGAICTFKDGRFIWRSQAMCGEHKYKMVPRREENQIKAFARGVSEYCVWDNISIAFHVDNREVLKFDDEQLGKNVTTCRKRHPTINLFDTPGFAKGLVTGLWSLLSDK